MRVEGLDFSNTSGDIWSLRGGAAEGLMVWGSIKANGSIYKGIFKMLLKKLKKNIAVYVFFESSSSSKSVSNKHHLYEVLIVELLRVWSVRVDGAPARWRGVLCSLFLVFTSAPCVWGLGFRVQGSGFMVRRKVFSVHSHFRTKSGSFNKREADLSNAGAEDVCKAQLQAQGPSRAGIESNKEETNLGGGRP